MKHLLFIFWFCIGFIHIGKSQDIHFSQFDYNPMTINPGLTGVFIGDQRASISYKDQWKSFNSSYVTHSFSFDSGLLKKRNNGGWMGAGLNVFRDVAGASKLGSTKVLLSISGIVELSRNQQITAGIQGGISQNSMSPSELTWDDQYVGGAYSATNPTQEVFAMNPFVYTDLAAGVSWNYTTGSATLSSYDATRFELGMAIHHINRPSMKFSNSNERLHRKVIAHGKGNIGIKNSHFMMIPTFMAAFQGPSKEIVLGCLLRYRLQEASLYTGYFSEMAIAVGTLYRVGDAAIPSVLIEVGSFALGVSYDVNISGLNSVSNGKGGIEIVLRFVNPNPFSYGQGRPSL
jgi:type IX secretion system PorP/SprF family membrane protein